MKNARIWPSLLMTALAFIVVLRSLDKGIWPIVLSVLGFVGFLALSITFIFRLKKQSKKSIN